MTGTLIEKTAESIAHRARWAHVARECIKAVEGFKGKTRDRLCIAYFFGAHTMHVIHTPDQKCVVPCVYLVSIRGYSEVLDLATMDEQDQVIAPEITESEMLTEKDCICLEPECPLNHG